MLCLNIVAIINKSKKEVEIKNDVIIDYKKRFSNKISKYADNKRGLNSKYVNIIFRFFLL